VEIDIKANRERARNNKCFSKSFYPLKLSRNSGVEKLCSRFEASGKSDEEKQKRRLRKRVEEAGKKGEETGMRDGTSYVTMAREG